MFLNKRAEEAFINFVKQAKEAMTGENQDYREIVNLILNKDFNSALARVKAMDEKDKGSSTLFFNSKEFKTLKDSERLSFQESYNQISGISQEAKKIKDENKEEELPEPKETPENKESVD